MELPDAILLYRKYCNESGIACREPHRHVCDRGSYWYFVLQEPLVGGGDVIISKEDGKLTKVGSGLGIDRETAFWAYEHGLLTGKCDLIITDCGSDPDTVIDILTKTPPSQRGLKLSSPSRDRWRRLLSALPVEIFSGASLYSYAYELWKAERDQVFAFEIRPVANAAVDE